MTLAVHASPYLNKRTSCCVDVRCSHVDRSRQIATYLLAGTFVCNNKGFSRLGTDKQDQTVLFFWFFYSNDHKKKKMYKRTTLYFFSLYSYIRCCETSTGQVSSCYHLHILHQPVCLLFLDAKQTTQVIVLPKRLVLKTFPWWKTSSYGFTSDSYQSPDSGDSFLSICPPYNSLEMSRDHGSSNVFDQSALWTIDRITTPSDQSGWRIQLHSTLRVVETTFSMYRWLALMLTASLGTVATAKRNIVSVGSLRKGFWYSSGCSDSLCSRAHSYDFSNSLQTNWLALPLPGLCHYRCMWVSPPPPFPCCWLWVCVECVVWKADWSFELRKCESLGRRLEAVLFLTCMSSMPVSHAYCHTSEPLKC